MTWTILGVTEWSASDASDGLPVSGSRTWPSGANAAGDIGIMTLVARDTASPPTGLDDWTLIDSYTSGDTDSNGLRNCWVYQHVRGGSNPAIHDTWVTSYAGGIAAYRHSSETTFTIGTPVQEVASTASTTHTLTAGVSSPGTDALIIVAAFNGRAGISAISSTTPSTGASSEDSTTAPSTSAWHLRHLRGSGATPVSVFSLADCVLDSGSTGAITTTQLNTKGVLIGFSVLPGSGGGGGGAAVSLIGGLTRSNLTQGRLVA